MKAKSIVKHKITNEIGFVLSIREGFENRCDVQWSFEHNENSKLSFYEQLLCNQGCYSFDELEVIRVK